MLAMSAGSRGAARLLAAAAASAAAAAAPSDLDQLDGLTTSASCTRQAETEALADVTAALQAASVT
jgi:hypothetical protein